MKLKKLVFLGWKGMDREVTLFGRDLFVADNKERKTALIQGVEFLSSGSVLGMKKGERLCLLTHDSGSVTGVFERDDGTEFTFSRTLTWKPGKEGQGGSLVEGFQVHPKGTEKSLADAAERLRIECGARPFKLFDLPGFLAANEEKRLAMLMGFAPSRMVDGENKVEIERPEVAGVAEEVVTAARDDILGVPFQGTLVDALVFYADIGKDRAKDQRQDVKRQSGAVAELGVLGTDDMREAETFLASFATDIAEARANLEELLGHERATEERLSQIKHLKSEIAIKVNREAASGQVIEANTAAVEGCVRGVEHADAYLEEMREVLNHIRSGRETQVSELEAKVRDLTEKRAEALDKARAAEAAERDKIRDCDNTSDHAMRISVELDSARSTLAAAMDAIAARACPTCGGDTGEEEEARERMAAFAQGLTDRIGMLEGQMKEAEEAHDARVSESGELDEQAVAEQALFETLGDEIAAAKDAMEEIGRQVEAQETAVAEALKRAETAIAVREDNIEAGRVYKATLEQSREDKARLDTQLAEISDNLPKEIQEGAIAGARLRLQELEHQREGATEVQRRFTDQETLRKTLSESEARLTAFEAWQKAFQDALRKELRNMALPVFEMAIDLISSIWPGETLRLSWETPRGKPGLSVGLWKMGGKDRPWAALSGAERGVIGLAIALCLSAGYGKKPLLLMAECETMTDTTQEKSLTAAARIAGVTQLLFTTHHPMTGVEEGGWFEHFDGSISCQTTS